MSTGIIQEESNVYPPHTHDWADLGALGGVDEDGNPLVAWLCYICGERTEEDPT
jgi:hypothetical protein